MAFDDLLGALAPNSAYAARQGKIASIPTALVQDAARAPLAVAEPLAGAINQLPQQYPEISRLVQNLAPIAANMGGDPMAASKIRLNQALVPYYGARQQEALASAGATRREGVLSAKLHQQITAELPDFNPNSPRSLSDARVIASRLGPEAVELFDEAYDPNAIRNAFTDRQDEYKKGSAAYDEVESHFRILANATPGDPLAQRAMIIAFAKMLDPESVVRTSEGEQIQAAGGAAAHAQVFMDYWFSNGNLLIPNQEAELRSAAANVMNARRALQMEEYGRFRAANEAAGISGDLNAANLPLPPAADGRQWDGQGGAGGNLDLVHAEAAPAGAEAPTQPPEYGAMLVWSKKLGEYFWLVPRTQAHLEQVMLQPNMGPQDAAAIIRQGWDLVEAN